MHVAIQYQYYWMLMLADCSHNTRLSIVPWYLYILNPASLVDLHCNCLYICFFTLVENMYNYKLLSVSASSLFFSIRVWTKCGWHLAKAKLMLCSSMTMTVWKIEPYTKFICVSGDLGLENFFFSLVLHHKCQNKNNSRLV